MAKHKQLVYTIYYKGELYRGSVIIPEGTTCPVGSSVALQLISEHALKEGGLRIFGLVWDKDAALVWNITDKEENNYEREQRTQFTRVNKCYDE